MISITVSIVIALAVQQLQAAPASSPTDQSSVNSPTVRATVSVSPGNNNDQCGSISQFYPEYCCHYDGVLLPNPRQHDLTGSTKESLYSDANREFSHFIPLIQRRCHPKLLTLLCFFYFPICIVSPQNSELISIFPCKSVCEEVTDPNGECTQVLQQAGLPWADHFNCDNYTYNGQNLYKDEGCVSNALPIKECPKNPGTTTTTTTTAATTAAPTTAASTTAAPTTAASTTAAPTTAAPTTAAPTEDPCNACEVKPAKCRKCDFRDTVGGKTFINNERYNFAAKATFVSYTTHKCRRALNFTLDVQYDLKSSDDCSLAPQIPSSFLVLGEHEGCEAEEGRVEYGCFKGHSTVKNSDKPLTAGEAYLVAGTYSKPEGCNPLWEVTTKSLITKWSGKNVESFITRGNNDRC